ncbi:MULTISPECIES: hypothetical protein [Burkholderia]|nr:MULTISPECIES: hypothetical protein [Burkholderia]HDR9508216.1 hypothetical protein [Burkholderia cepacia]
MHFGMLGGYCRQLKGEAGVARFLLKWGWPRNGCALPDDRRDKEDSP